LGPTRFSISCGLILCALGASHALAQSIEPRAYSPAPVGTHFAIVALTDSRGAIPTDPDLPLSDIDINVRAVLLAYATSLNLFGKSAKFDFIAPIGRLKGKATYFGEPIERDVSGLGDPLGRMTILLHGAPAMNLAQFRNYKQDLVLGASVQVSIPMGQYAEDRLLNLSTNRWSIKPELGASKSWGRWTLETAVGATFFTTNDEFFGGHKREQKPIYSAQGHVIYNLAPGTWVALNLSWFGGGRTTIDGVRDDNLQKNWRTGAVFAVPLNRQLSLKANASTGVSTRTGNSYDLYGIALQYRWGTGG
jgi:hypothetical protein